MSGNVVGRGEGVFLGVRGVRLRYRSWEARSPRAALILLHGFAEHVGRYDAVAAGFAAERISTFGYDQRGHGLSDGRRGYARRFGDLLEDVDRFRREVESMLVGRTPLFLLGHSMGGLVVLRYLQEYQAAVRGAIVISPWLATVVRVPRWKVGLTNILDRVLPAVPFRARVDATMLSRDPSVVCAYMEDPLVHDIMTPRLFSEISAAMGLVMRRVERIRVPVLFLLPGRDSMVDARRSAALAGLLPDHLVTVHNHPGGRHELLNEPERPIIMREIQQWIEARTADLMSES